MTPSDERLPTADRGPRRRRRVGVPAQGLLTGAGLAAFAVLAGSPLGRLADPFSLLVVLPPLALALAALGIRDAIVRPIRRLATPQRRLVAAYGTWLATSAVLTLDVAAVASGSVGMLVAREPGERRWQLGAAVLGSNLGSLLFP